MQPSLAPLLALSGAAALTAEVVWMRRLGLTMGSTALATTLTLTAYMLGLGLGAGLAARVRWRRPPRGYGLLELAAAAWVLLFPHLLGLVEGRLGSGTGAAFLVALLVLAPPGVLHGATLPAAAAATREGAGAARLYAANTAGAVVGVLCVPLLWLPLLGVRGTELVAAGGAALAGLLALTRPGATDRDAPPVAPLPLPPGVGLAVAAAGGVALSLEVVWTRLGALLLGGSVHAFALVLAVYLAGIALGARLGARLGSAALGPALAALGAGAALGTVAFRALPHGIAMAWDLGGEWTWLPAGALLMATAMAGAPIASGAVFAAALARVGGDPAATAGRLLLANTIGAVVGAGATGLWLLPALGLRGACLLGAGLACLAALRLERSRLVVAGSAVVAAVALVGPRWDPMLYAVGLPLRLHEFSDLSPGAVEAFAHQGWTLRSHQDGRTATVAVGEGTRSGTRWLSINGKVDASDGEDMPTQLLSAEIPLRIRPGGDVLVVGLASGVTAGEALRQGARSLTVVELEPAVVAAAAHFAHVNQGVLEDPRARIVVGDARAFLHRSDQRYHVLISEPSNPWLTGVSNLFTAEYWRLCRSRLARDGVFVQWLQLYGLPPASLRSLVATFLDAFGEAWLFETISGSDVLLVAGAEGTAPALPAGLPLQPTLDPAGVRRLAGSGVLATPRNTDDRPGVELSAPWWLHRRTGALNAALIARAAGGA